MKWVLAVTLLFPKETTMESLVVRLRKEDPEQPGVHFPHLTNPLQLERQKARPLYLPS